MKIKYILLSLCLNISVIAELKKPIIITIWVHGSIVGPNIVPNFFYRKVGMVKATDYAPRYHSRSIAQYFYDAAPEEYPLEHFYFWGWSGRLSRKARAMEAKTLYSDLLTLLANYRKTDPDATFFIRLMSHSHGGNLLLNLAQAYDVLQPLDFDELILLACPVQFATKEYVTCKQFKKIYSFYSSDIYQVIDFQRIYKNGRYLKMHSSRKFEEVPHLHQAKLKINGRFLFHIEFLLKKLLRAIPQLCKELDCFYASLSPEQQKREKVLYLQTHCGQTTISKKLLC